ncbi:MAG: SWIM zinc finger family protein [Acidobacteria bacterium]|nr:SWIM zinc finger family protein [Acidobacteriota bacterium]
MAKKGSDFLSRQMLIDYADRGSFERGQKYFNSGNVFDLEEYQGRIVAKVSGTDDYRVKIWAEHEDEIGYDCSCPYGEEGNFCKHCVAVGLAWLAKRDGKDSSKNVKGGKKATLDDIKDYLQTREKTELVEMLMQQVLENDALRGRLTLAVARSRPRGVDVHLFRQQLEEVFGDIGDDGDYYDDDYGYFGNHAELENVIESIEGLYDDEHFGLVVDLCEYGLELASNALKHVHETDGAIEDAMDKMQELHLAACKRIEPDPEILANRLFELEIDDEWGYFRDAAEIYADVLGRKGLLIYRELAEKEWEKVPFLQPNDKRSFAGNRHRITRMMESIAKAENDFEKLVEIKKRDLSTQYRYYEIAELYKSRRRYNEVLEWAERGVADFPDDERLDFQLGELLADEYHRRGRHDEAMQIVWRHFTENTDLGRYDTLKKHAARVGPADGAWPAWREKALEFIRADIARRKKNKAAYWSYERADHSLLVEIFLSENLSGEALREAEEGGCRESLWLRLAKDREAKHPEDSLKILRGRIGPKIEETNNQAYEQAGVWLKDIKRLLKRLDRESEFDDFLVVLRVNYKAKRNFIKLLDSTKW